MHTEFIL